MAVQEQARAAPLEELLEVLAAAVRVAEHRKREHEELLAALSEAAKEAMLSLGCNRLEIDGVVFVLTVRDCVYCGPYSVEFEPTPDPETAGRLLRVLRAASRAAALLERAAELAPYMKQEDLSLATAAEERLAAFKQRFCRG